MTVNLIANTGTTFKMGSIFIRGRLFRLEDQFAYIIKSFEFVICLVLDKAMVSKGL